MRDALLWHGAPKRFAERVAHEGAGQNAIPGDSPEESIAAGLERIVTCDPIAARMEKDIILIGPPGHGRTATAAKLTRRAAVARTAILPVAADLDGTAGGAQLAAYLEQERGQIRTATTPDALFDMLRAARDAGHRCVIDLPSINPFDQDDMDHLRPVLGGHRLLTPCRYAFHRRRIGAGSAFPVGCLVDGRRPRRCHRPERSCVDL